MASTTILPQRSGPSERIDPARVGKGARQAQVLDDLRKLCRDLQPGDLIPARVELIRNFGASERAVRRALDDLERDGVIVRRQGAGTFVAEPRGTSADWPRHLTDSRTIVAIAEPDHAIFERAMSLLFRHTAAQDLSLACRFVDAKNPALDIPAARDDSALGYIVFGRSLLPVAEQLHGAGVRTVLVGSPLADSRRHVPTVESDHELGGYLATRHLIDLGHRRIAFRGWGDWPQMQRHRGHQQALAEARKQGIELQDSVIYEDLYSEWEQDPSVARTFFTQPNAPTGIVVWNDHEALPLMSLLSFIGVRVPQDVSVVGYDNLPEGQRVLPTLTTVDQAIEQQVRAAVALLTRATPPAPSHTTVVLPTLIPRASTGPAKGAE